MTQAMPIAIVAAVMAADRGYSFALPLPGSGLGGYALVVVLPIVLLEIIAALHARHSLRRIDRGHAGRAIRSAERGASIARLLLLLHHIAVFATFDVLGAIRVGFGDLVLLDEAIAMAAPVIGLLGLWWGWYPIECRLRAASTIRRLDEGLPIYRPPSRLAYVVGQFRLQMALLLVPIVVVVAIAETIARVLPMAWTDAPDWAFEVATATSGLLVLLLAPAAARRVLDVVPLAEGEVYEDLRDICRRHRVSVRKYLLWHTNGTIVNAAVMGLIGPLRYVLLTDGLIEGLPRDQVRAVIAHEVGHVRCWHMPWLITALMVSLLSAGVAVGLLIDGAASLSDPWSASTLLWVDGIATAISVVVALWLFGWISRRYERQADVFAVRSMGEDGEELVTEQAVDAMAGALESVARLSGIRHGKRSWRHGSIAWRIDYLQSLVGCDRSALPIDRVVRNVRIALLVAAAAVVAVMIWWSNAPVEIVT